MPSQADVRGLRPSLLLGCLFWAVFASPAISADKASDGRTNRQCGDMAERFVNERLVMWQQRLMLTGWKIWILMSPASGLKPNTLGNIQWDVDDKSATIRVLRASEYALPCREMLADMEFTVVHELIHLELSYLPRKEADRSIEESAVNQITKALLSLDRRK